MVTTGVCMTVVCMFTRPEQNRLVRHSSSSADARANMLKYYVIKTGGALNISLTTET